MSDLSDARAEPRGLLDDLRDAITAAQAEQARLDAEVPLSENSLTTLAAPPSPPWLARIARELLAARKALAAVREIHATFDIYSDCGHDEHPDNVQTVYVEECGTTCTAPVEICVQCCCDGGDEQTERCASDHDHGGAHPICATRAALALANPEVKNGN